MQHIERIVDEWTPALGFVGAFLRITLSTFPIITYVCRLQTARDLVHHIFYNVTMIFMIAMIIIDRDTCISTKPLFLVQLEYSVM